MARAIWTGAISFGLVNVPVKLYSATEQKDVSFHQFQRGTNERIRYRRVAGDSDEEVEYKDIVKGYELDKDQYVIVTPEELEAVEPGRSRTIDIEDFVSLDEVDPVHFEKSYYLGPADRQAAAKPYALLREALRQSNKVAIARFVMRTKQYLAAVRASGPVLVLETMFFPDEVRPPTVVDDLPDDVEVSDRELDIAQQLIESLTTKWDPDRYHDTYRERVLELIDAKAKGQEVVTERPEDEGAKVVDLMSALEASLEQARGGGDGDGPEDTGTAAPERAEGGGSGRGSRTKEELYEEAQRRHIPGRSSMSKEQLERALDEAS